MKNILFTLSAVLLCTLSYAMEQAPAENLPTLSSLSLRQKIGQLCIAAAVSNEERNQDMLAQWAAWEPRYHLEIHYVEHLINEYGVGGVIFYGKHTLPQEQLSLTRHYQSLSKIPLLIALDAECGLAWHFEKGSVIRFPFNMTIGAAHDPNLTYQLGYEIGQQLKAIGVHINFAPVVDINNNPKNPIIGMRSFGSDKQRVAVQGIASMQGLQDAGIIACAKHFPGHGDTAVDSHMALPLIPHSRERLESIELFPFKRLIDAGVKSVMLAHLEVPALEKKAGLPSSLSHAIVTDLLQKEMGFTGLVITDALGMKGATNVFEPGLLEVKALQAGADVLLCPIDIPKAIDYIEQAVINGLLSEEEIDKKVQKVLTAKKWALENVSKANIPLEERLQTVKAKALKKLIYAKAVTLVKPEGQDSFKAPKAGSMVISIGENLNPFLKAIQDTAASPYRYLHLSQEKDLKVFYKTMSEEKNERQPSEVIIGLDESLVFKDKSATADLQHMIDLLKAKGISVTIALFCSPYHIDDIKNADRILLAYENDPDAQQAAGEVVCGIRKAEGILPID